MAFDIITVGSGTLDAFVHTDSELIKIKTATTQEELIAYPSGSKILIERLKYEVGGGGTNTAVAFARLGLKTGWIGCIGEDHNSELIFKVLKKEKIDFLGTKEKGLLSGFSVILDSIEHDRTILTFKGVNDKLKFSKLNKPKLKTRWYYMASMVGESFKSLEKISSFAKKNNSKVAFNPSSYMAKKGLRYILKILRNTDILILNHEEAGYLVGSNNLAVQLKILQKNVPEVIITNGKKGAYYFDGKQGFHAESHNLKVVEATGAGDAFASTFVGLRIKGKDPQEAMRLATTNAESVITNVGAKEILLTYKKLINEHRKRKTIVKKFKV